MNKMFVSGRLGVSPDGPVAVSCDEPVHLRQGDLDGACGPYCLSMALIATGALTRLDAQNLERADGRTRLGKFRDGMLAFGALICDGTTDDDLIWLASFFRQAGLKASQLQGNKRQIVDQLVGHFEQGAIPIIKVLWEGGGRHWLMGVGYQSIQNANGEQLTHLLCLDPGQGAPKASVWNAVVNVFDSDGAVVNKGRLSSMHWGLSGVSTKCQVEGAIVLA